LWQISAELLGTSSWFAEHHTMHTQVSKLF